MSDEVGTDVSAWDGYITGRNLELVPGERIVQSWRTTEFEDEHEDSIITLILEELDDGTLLTLAHANVPDEQTSYELGGWEKHYFEPMKEYFANSERTGAGKKSKRVASSTKRAAARKNPSAQHQKRWRARASVQQQPSAKLRPGSRARRLERSSVSKAATPPRLIANEPALQLRERDRRMIDSICKLAISASARAARSSAWLILPTAMPSARTRSARATTPTSCPSRTTGSRLIPRFSIRRQASAIGVSLVTVRGSRVITSSTLLRESGQIPSRSRLAQS